MVHSEHFMEVCKKLGNRIKNLREARGLTIYEISNITGIRVQYIKKIESGNAYRLMIDKHLVKIAEALNVKISELFFK